MTDPRYTDPTKFTLVEGSGEWSALYYDGLLVVTAEPRESKPFPVYGDHYVIQEKLCALLGVAVRQTDCLTDPSADRKSPLRGVAATLVELDGRESERRSVAERAAVLRDQGEALVREAEALERQAR